MSWFDGFRYEKKRVKKQRPKLKLTQKRGSMSLVSRLIEKLTIEDQDILRKYGYYNRLGQWFPEHDSFVNFVMLRDIRPPSHMWPHSFERAVTSCLFGAWLIENDPETAIEIWGCPDQIATINRAAELSRMAEEYEAAMSPIMAERELLTREMYFDTPYVDPEDQDQDQDDRGL
jgi:hypothetical protein